MTKADFNAVKANLQDGFSAAHHEPMNGGISIALENIHGDSPDYVDVPLTFHRTPLTKDTLTETIAPKKLTMTDAQELVGADLTNKGKSTSLAQSIFPGAAETNKLELEPVVDGSD